jgi:hypothetical protein
MPFHEDPRPGSIFKRIRRSGLAMTRFSVNSTVYFFTPWSVRFSESFDLPLCLHNRQKSLEVTGTMGQYMQIGMPDRSMSTRNRVHFNGYRWNTNRCALFKKLECNHICQIILLRFSNLLSLNSRRKPNSEFRSMTISSSREFVTGYNLLRIHLRILRGWP